MRRYLILIFLFFCCSILFCQNTAISKMVSFRELKEGKSQVDRNIPVRSPNNKQTFVVIIANEDYSYVADVPYAINDGSVFMNYCNLTLGIPKDNIHFVKNATKNDLDYHIKWLQKIINVYNGDAKVIFYYAGHGIPDDSQTKSYLLPVDGYGNEVSTGYAVDNLYEILGELSSKMVFVILDACFSGAHRDGGMLVSARGVALKVKPNTPKGNMIVLSATQKDEIASAYEKEKHGLFTYFLLKKLQDSAGNVTLGELSHYVIDQVLKTSVVVNGKQQTPLILYSNSISEDWRNWKLR